MSNRAHPHVKVAFVDTETAQAIERLEPTIGARGRFVGGAALLFGIVLAVYVVALRGSFIFLDDQAITANQALRTWGEGLRDIWLHPTAMPAYQPLAYSAYLVEYRLFATHSSGGYIAVNVLLHALNVVLLWTLLRRLELVGALGAAVLFAVHPANVEAVAWISRQPFLLCAAFSLSSLLVYLKDCETNSQPTCGRYALVIGLLAAALMSHAAAAVLPMAILAILWWERGRITRQDITHILPMLIMAALWCAVVLISDHRRAAVLGATDQIDFISRILIAGRATWIYLGHLLLPVGLSFGYPKWNIDSIIPALLLLLIAMAMFGAWKNRSRFGRGPFASSSLVLVALLPALLFRGDLESYTYIADHRLYMASAILIVSLVAFAADQTEQWPSWIAPTFAGVIAAVLGTLSILRVPDYRTSQDLWSAALRTDPRSVPAHNSLGLIELNDNKNTIAAIQHFQIALAASPDDVRTLLNIAQAYSTTGDADTAIMRYHEAIMLSPHEPDAHFGLALALSQQGQSSASLEEYNKVLQYRPDHVITHNNLGQLHADRGELEQAENSYRRAIQINPSFIPPYINLARLYFQQGKIQQAADMLQRVTQVDPGNFWASMNAGAMVFSLAERPDIDKHERDTLLWQSERFFRAAVIRQPDSPEAHAQLGVSLLRQQKQDEALFHLEKAVELDPRNQEVRQILERARLQSPKAAAGN